MRIEFIKCHGSENDFVMIDELSCDYGFTEEQRSLLSQLLCDRNGDVGADGVLYFIPSKKGDGMMRMFNPDGSEAEMCGNGIRCIGRLAHEVLDRESFKIETLKGLYDMKLEEPLAAGVATYSVCIDTVSLHPIELPMNSPHYPHIDFPIPKISPNRHFTALSLTNPHIISIVPSVEIDELENTGSRANTDQSVFPKGVNLTFCQVRGKNEVFTGTYERGAGITSSCGTGMSAATLASCLNGHTPFNEWIDVYNPGGKVRCKAVQDEAGRLQVYLLGNATYTDLYTVEMDFDNGAAFQITNRQNLPEETEAYEKLKQQG